MTQTKRPLRICVLGNNSGRNAGDNAILGCLMKDISAQYPEAHFVVPTINPSFVREHYSQYSVEPVSLMPWALSIKIFGLPVFRAVLGSDLVLVTDNILFDMKLFNPLFNYLSTLSLVLPLAHHSNIPVVMYNMSLGPIKTAIGKRMMERVVRSASLIILRDEQSKGLLDRLQIPYKQIEQGADCAVNTEVVSAERLQTITAELGLFRNPAGTIGINVNAYLDAYLKGGKMSADLDHFADIISETADQLIEQLGVDILFIVTQVMDSKITDAITAKIRNRDHVQVVSNKTYSYQELTSIMAQLELLVGMRTHAIILASSVCTPVVGIITYPKTAGYLKAIEQDQWTIHFDDLDTEPLTALIGRAFEARAQTREAMKPIIKRERAKANRGALLLEPFVYRSKPADSLTAV